MLAPGSFITALPDNEISNISDLNEQVKSQKQDIVQLTSALSSARANLSNGQSKIALDDVSMQTLNNKYSNLVQDYNKLASWYSTLQSQYKTAQSNCNVMSKLNQLELEKRNLGNQLKSVSVFDRDVEKTKQDIRWQIQQNHERLMDMQNKLNCS